MGEKGRHKTGKRKKPSRGVISERVPASVSILGELWSINDIAGLVLSFETKELGLLYLPISQSLAGSRWIRIVPGTSFTGNAAYVPKGSLLTETVEPLAAKYIDARGQEHSTGERNCGGGHLGRTVSSTPGIEKITSICLEHLKDVISPDIRWFLAYHRSVE